MSAGQPRDPGCPSPWSSGYHLAFGSPSATKWHVGPAADLSHETSSSDLLSAPCRTYRCFRLAIPARAPSTRSCGPSTRPRCARSRSGCATRRGEVERGWGDKYVERVHAKGKLTARERIARLDRSGHARVRGRHLRQLRRGVPGRAALSRRRRGDRVRVASPAAGAWSSPTTTPSRRARGGRARRRRSSAPRTWRCACACRPSTSSTAAGCSCPSSRAASRARRGAGHIFKMNSLLCGGRRAADRRRVRRLHRGRRLHADHQRPRLHDRAGLHGHRRRGAHQGRQERRSSPRSTSAAPRCTCTSPAAPTSACPTTRC